MSSIHICPELTGSVSLGNPLRVLKDEHLLYTFKHRKTHSFGESCVFSNAPAITVELLDWGECMIVMIEIYICSVTYIMNFIHFHFEVSRCVVMSGLTRFHEGLNSYAVRAFYFLCNCTYFIFHSRNKSKPPSHPVLSSISILFCYHLGTVVKGSFLITIVRIPRIILLSIYNILKEKVGMYICFCYTTV